MKIYEFHNADNQAYIYAPDDVCDRCNPDPPRPLASGWSPPIFEIVGRDEYRSYLPKTDFTTFTLATMVLSARGGTSATDPRILRGDSSNLLEQ
ncbi:MAG: hypothetical protein HY288_05975 [Planctomycetia bacterium]|nr:hypothetical protein [Planctomycetia bacterium]